LIRETLNGRWKVLFASEAGGAAEGEIRSGRCFTQKAHGFPSSKASLTEFLPSPPALRSGIGPSRHIKVGLVHEEFLKELKRKSLRNFSSQAFSFCFFIFTSMRSEK